MVVSLKTNNFEACPDYVGRAVIRDFTPVKRKPSLYGDRDVLKAIVEVDLLRTDGTRHRVWSNYMTPSLHEKANLRKFLESVLGRALTAEELKGVDLETFIGLPVHVVVVQQHKDGETYANIAAIQPQKNGEPLKPDSSYVRIKDRPPKEGNSYQRVEQPVGDLTDLGATKIHVGRCQGLEVRDLAPEQVEALITHWLPTAKANPRPTADDRRLMAALEAWQAAQNKVAEPVVDVAF